MMTQGVAHTASHSVYVSQELFTRVERAARKMGVPLNRFMADALEHYLRRMENRDIAKAIAAACADGTDAEERRLLAAHKRAYARLVEGRSGRY
jgi:hypothetical protein